MGYRVNFDNGYTAEFQNEPTPQDIEEAFSQLSKSSPSIGQQASSASTPLNKPNPNSVGGFVANEFLGSGPLQDRGALGSIVQNTVGSKGLAGVAQLPGRVAAAEITAKTANSIADAAAQLQETNNRLAQAYSTVPPEKRDELNKTIQENAKMIDMLYKRANGDDLQAYGITPGQALGIGANAALTVATTGTGSLAAKTSLKGAAGLAARVVEGSATGAAFQASSNLANKKNITENLGTAAIIGGALPLAGAALSKGKELLGKITKGAGQKIQSSTIRASVRDVKDGFKIETLNKYDLGGSLDQTLNKTNAKLNELNKQLTDTLAGSNATVDLQAIYRETADSFLGNKAQNFGEASNIGRVIKSLGKELDILGQTSVDLPTANILKRASGAKGSWSFGMIDKDAKATEEVYSIFYNRLKVAIENAANQAGKPGVRELNQQMAELIPVANAVIRRIPVAERNNAISLTDAIGLFATISNPKAGVLTAINKASKSGRVGNALVKKGASLLNPKSSKTGIGARIFGK